MARFAILNNDMQVINVAEWDDNTPWLIPGILVRITDDTSPVAVGWVWDPGLPGLVPPAPDTPPETPLPGGQLA